MHLGPWCDLRDESRTRGAQWRQKYPGAQHRAHHDSPGLALQTSQQEGVCPAEVTIILLYPGKP